MEAMLILSGSGNADTPAVLDPDGVVGQCLSVIDRLSLDEQQQVVLDLNRTVIRRLIDKAAETARADGTFLNY